MAAYRKRKSASILFAAGSMLALMIGLIAFSASAQTGAGPQAGYKDGYVAWKPIAGARGYRVQVRPADDPERIVQDETVQETYMKVDLQVGRYEIRTTPLNDFGRVTVWSTWQPLRIVISRRPELDPESDRTLAVNNRNKASYRFSVTGNNFFPDVTKVAVRDRRTKKTIPVRELDISEDGRRLLVELDIAGTPEGSYDLELINPFNKTLVRENYLDVSNRREPGSMNLADYQAYVKELKRGCRSATELPDILIKQCEEYFIVLNLSDRDRTNLYYYLRMSGENYYDRMSAYDYYASVCPPVFRPGQQYMQQRLASLDEGVDALEKARIRRSLAALAACEAQ